MSELDKHIEKVRKETKVNAPLFSSKEKEKEWLKAVRYNKVQQGYDFGSAKLDESYRLKRKTVTGILGLDNVGKTTFQTFLATGYAKRHNLKGLLLMRENDAESVRDEIIEMYLGCSPNRATDQDYLQAYNFAYNNFEIIDDEIEIEIENFFELLERAVNEKKVDFIFLDPYNSVIYDMSPKVNYPFLKACRQFARKHNVAFIISMHIVSEKARNYKYDNKDLFFTFENETIELNGLPKIPHKSHVEGGQPIANRLDDIIIVHRVIKHEVLSYYTMVSIDKVKKKKTGGKPTMDDNYIKLKKTSGYMAFIDENGINPLTGKLLKPSLEKTKVEPNYGFDSENKTEFNSEFEPF